MQNASSALVWYLRPRRQFGDSVFSLTAAHRHVGRIVHAFAHLKVGEPEVGGKVHPCVVKAVSDGWFLVRLVFLNPRRYAGIWRSVRIDEWGTAGLKHQSFVTSQRRMERRERAVVVGRLPTKNWNRICCGEVNSEGNL